MRSSLLVSILVLSLAAGAQAGAIIKVVSDVKARVSVDGEDLGVAPLIVRDLKPGKYEIKVENVETGQVQTFAVRSPKAGTVEREIHASWNAPAAPELPSAQAATVAAPAVVAEPPPPPYVQPAPPPPPCVVAAEEKRIQKNTKERFKVRARNTVLGAALANEVFNKGKSKDTIRKAAVAVGLLNEAANR